MRLLDDRSVIARERDVPGLSLVLDPVAVAALVAASTGCDVQPLGATHARYKPATNCVVGHRLSCDGEELLCAAKAFRPDDRDKLDKACLKSIPDAGAGWGVLVASAEAVTVSTLANDRDLPALPLLIDPAQRPALLERLLGTPDASTMNAPCLRTIRHKPERRWVGTVDVDGQPTSRIKAYRPEDVRRAVTGHEVMESRAFAPIGLSRRRAVIVARWVDGISLADLLARGDHSCIDSVGVRLAEQHLRPTDARLAELRSFELRSAVRTAADAIGILDPQLERIAQKVARRAARHFVDGSPTSLVHGDFSADQVIRSDHEIRFIDFDESRNGDPIVDLASFAADLIYAGLDGRLGVGADDVTNEIAAAYSRAGGPARLDRLGPHLAGALLRRAVLPFRERRHDWLETCHGMVAAAAAVLEGRVVAT